MSGILCGVCTLRFPICFYLSHSILFYTNHLHFSWFYDIMRRQWDERSIFQLIKKSVGFHLQNWGCLLGLQMVFITQSIHWLYWKFFAAVRLLVFMRLYMRLFVFVLVCLLMKYCVCFPGCVFFILRC